MSPTALPKRKVINLAALKKRKPRQEWRGFFVIA
jgi:hypothetical protein